MSGKPTGLDEAMLDVRGSLGCMYAAVVTDFAEPPVYGEFPEPRPGDGEVVAEVRAAAVSNLVRLVAAGEHYSSAAEPPMVAGVDGVAQLPDGSLVYIPEVRSPWGTLAERAAVPLAATRPVPEGLAVAQAAAVVNAAFASWLPLTRILACGGLRRSLCSAQPAQQAPSQCRSRSTWAQAVSSQSDGTVPDFSGPPNEARTT